MPKVDYADLESVTKFLDKLNKENVSIGIKTISTKLSKMIKDKYTEIKPDYERKS